MELCGSSIDAHVKSVGFLKPYRRGAAVVLFSPQAEAVPYD